MELCFCERRIFNLVNFSYKINYNFLIINTKKINKCNKPRVQHWSLTFKNSFKVVTIVRRRDDLNKVILGTHQECRGKIASQI